MKPYLLRFHRWLTLVFALPLAVVIVTGLLLSLPPILQTASIVPGSLTPEKVASLLAKHDPQGQARGLRIDTFANTMSLQGVGPDGGVDIDLATGAETDEDSWLSEILGASRGVHQRLIGDLGWLVTGSTAAMMVIIGLGVFMGWPRFANTVSGWHKATAWVLLPLLILSPLTALLMAAGINFSQPAPRSPPVPIAEAVRLIGARHDLSGLEWVRVRGGRQLARVNDGFHQQTYVVGRDGLQPAPANWPRTLHEGVFLGVWGGVVNLVISVAFVLLMGTGLFIWARRSLRRRRPRALRPAPAASA